ncbi:YceI family protein [Candidatus Woesearchaeota archaeon]|nr:YceI family protein [Candidatus Woesearchaeota archaeon]OFZ56281.1 MAG: hypothetical protein A3D92_15015 [Bacteroidetes bacterium RIFCSPHIGHO2_02_FULL_44_7]
MKKEIILTLLALALLTACSSPELEVTSSQTEKEQTSTSEPVEMTDAKTVLQLADGMYVLNTQKSTLGWTASRIVGIPHVGTVSLREGVLIAEKDSLWGDFTIDLNSISESKNNSRFLTHVKSADFFDVETYPTSQFTINSAEKTGTDSYSLTGELTIKDITREITFPATFLFEGDSLLANASFEINRLDWNITYDSGSIFGELGDKAIKDEIGYALLLVFEA